MELNTNEEIWVPVTGFESYCEVSNTGRVRTMDRVVYRNGKPRTLKGKLLTILYDQDGYPRTQLMINKKRWVKNTHRIVATMFIPNPENKPCINHIDGNKTNNNVSNLEWCTVAENNQHAFDIGIKKNRVGEQCNFSKLTEKDVQEIWMIGKNMTQKEIGKMYGVCDSTISQILKYKIWQKL